MTRLDRPTVRDVAARAGVSVATVDRVVNRRAPVKEVTARRVLDAAQAIGFHASALVQRRIEERRQERTLGFLLQRQSEAFYQHLGSAVARATREAAAIRGRPIVEHLEDLTPTRVAERLRRLAEKSDAIAIVAADHPKITEAVEAARDRDVPVFALLSDISAPARTGFLGIDHRKAGRTAGWAVARLAERSGRPNRPAKVGILIGMHRYLGHELCEISFRSYVREHAPEIQVLDALMSLEHAHFAHETTLDLLRREPDLVGLYVAGGGMEGVIGALREHGRYEKLVVVCNELIPETRAALLDGIVDLVIATPIELLADRAVDAMVAAIEGRATDIPTQTQLPFDLFVSENI